MELLAKFRSALIELDMTQSQLGSYAGLNNSRVSRGVTGEIPFDTAEAQAISTTIDAMRDLQASTPLPINWRPIGKVKPIVDQRRKQMHEESDPIVPRCMIISVSRLKYFAKLHNGEVHGTINENEAAAFENPDVALEVVRALDKLGVRSWLVQVGALRRRSTISHSLIEVGFGPVAQTE
jgi:hypothetical protein